MFILSLDGSKSKVLQTHSRNIEHLHLPLFPRPLPGEIWREHSLWEHKILEHRAEIIEEYFSGLLSIVNCKFIFECAGGHFVVHFLHKLFQFLKGDDSFFAGSFHFVETFSKPALQTQSITCRVHVLNETK